MRTDQVIDLLSKIRERAHAVLAAELELRGHPGLVPSHGSILIRLYEQGALSMGALAKSIGRRKNTVTTLVHKLETAGYVRRQEAPGDDRITLVALTPKGEAFRADFMAISNLLLARTWGRITTSQRDAVMDGLEAMFDNLSDFFPQTVRYRTKQMEHNMREVIEFLTANRTVFLATSDQGAPRVRPFQFQLEQDGRLWFCTSKTKDVYDQLEHDQRVEFSCLSPDMTTLRITGSVNLKADEMAIKERIIKENELVRTLYGKADNPDFKVFSIDHGSATMPKDSI